MAEKQPIPKDPLQTRSLSLPIFLASAVLMASVVLAGYDEFYARRPYKAFQKDFVTVYLNYLDVLDPRQKKSLAKIQKAPEYQALVAQRDAAQALADTQVPNIAAKIGELGSEINNLTAVAKDSKAKLSSLRYQLETARTDSRRKNVQVQIDEVNAVALPIVKMMGEEESTTSMTLMVLDARLSALKAEKALLEKRRGDLSAPASLLQKEMAAFVKKRLNGPGPAAVAKLKEKIEAGLLGSEGKSVNDVLQIHIGEFDWVDRCESCHAGAREPVDMRVWDINETTPGDEPVDHARVWTSHPNSELLAIHDPSVFGCSMCHNGNGRSVTKVKDAHGKNKHWLYPLFDRNPEDVAMELGSFEAGCVQCHKNDLMLDYQPSPYVAMDEKGHAIRDDKGNIVEHDRRSMFNEGRWLFQHKGCWGCHKYEGVDTQPDEMLAIKTQILELDEQSERLAIAKKVERDLLAKSKIIMDISSLGTRRAELMRRQGDLAKERQRVGPNLKNLRSKVKREWILPWLLNPKAFRPDTKMPQFFENLPDLANDHATKIAAFLWQNNKPRQDIGQYAVGDAMAGEKLFKERGCLGCHVIEDDGKLIGDGFAANLSRVGEKIDYDFLVEWIMEPDSGVMPNLRLSEEESRNIATWLKSKVDQSAQYPETVALEDPKLAMAGQDLVRHYGCAGCHEIGGLEEDGRIGVELTKEGSKPKERLDFGRLEHGFKKAGRYTHRAYFEEKLRYPGVFGKGKVYEEENGTDRLKMPNFGLEESQITALASFLQGSIETEIPEEFRYQPDERARDIQKGWWVVKKYNCVGCHEVKGGEQPKLWSLPQYVGNEEGGKKRWESRPPSLVGIGFRTNPKWLAEFLRDPSQGHSDPHRNGLRNYLDVRMPSFRMSENEIQLLVRFFGALDSQPTPYIEPKLEPLSNEEHLMAREVFKGVNCTLCHAVGDPQRDNKVATAPILTWVGRKLKPNWTHRWLADPGAMLPGTSMPSNFTQEYRVTFKDGRTIVGTGFSVAKGKGRIKLMGGDFLRFKPAELLSSEPTRLIAEPIPALLKNYRGDHRELMMRYLHLNYDEAEVPKSMGGK